MREECAGCGEPIPEGEEGVIWCNTPLGMTTLKTHKTQACGKAALAARPEWSMVPGNRPPLSKAEKAKLKGAEPYPREPRP